ncbi:MAG: heat-inducible transcription repressor HrcA [Nitrospirae bacterium]|nr:heat-inducible transcription repressor HrcA [Nitrospirota bacterium]MBI3352452.1 heat-inducible transcription repressor HrcA [Nitrospirota bacterium]
MELTHRDYDILNATVVSYIKTATPIGSRTITKQFDFGLSPATIRNIMADLEDLGFLSQPHTSAGRIPTEKAYRYYVDQLLEENEPIEIEAYKFTKNDDLKSLLHNTSKILSLLSRYTSIVMAPQFNSMLFKHIKFISLRKNVVLAILVNSDGNPYNKTFELDETLSQKELDRFSAILNDRFSNKSLDDIKKSIFKEMNEEKKRYEQLLNKVFDFNKKNIQENQLFVEGTTNIMDLPEFTDVEKIKSLFRAFEEKFTLIKLLDRCLFSEGPQVLIGSENPFLEANECSLVISSFKLGGKEAGAIGIIGPIRMEYHRVISLVDYAAKMLTKAHQN